VTFALQVSWPFDVVQIGELGERLRTVCALPPLAPVTVTSAPWAEGEM
jgi:hypothetical protein